MDGLTYSRHATARMNQRGIRGEAVETLLAHGRRKRSRGADVYYMDRASRRSAREKLGPKAFARLEQSLNAYLVVADDGTLVTAARRLRRLHG